MKTFVALVLALSLLAACKKEGGTGPTAAGGGTSTPPAPPAGGGEAGKPAAPGEPAKSPSDPVAAGKEALGDVQKATAQAGEEAVKAAAAAREALGQAADPGFSLDKLKGALTSLSVDDLKRVADNLLGALQGQQGALQSLQTDLGNLGVTDVAKMGEIKKKIEASTSAIGDLKAKLGLVTDKLKEKGADVSKYTALLGG